MSLVHCTQRQVFVLMLLSAPAAAQTLLFEVVGKSAEDHFGNSIDRIQDLDGDGVVDVVIGAPGDNTVGPGAGRAVIVSGASGALLREVLGDNPFDQLGRAVAGIGDIDGDGKGDILVGEPGYDSPQTDCGRAVIFSSATGAVLRTHTWLWKAEEFGGGTWNLGDVTGDGVGDYAIQNEYVIGQFGGKNPGYGTCYSGATGAPILQLEHVFSMAGVRDTNGDGTLEFAVAHGQFDSSNVELRTGAAGTVLDAVASPYDFMGRVGPAGDFDGDGLREYVFAHGALGGQQVVEVRSKPHGVLLSLVMPMDEIGLSFDARGDVDGDGHRDVLVGFYGWVQAFSGLDGSLLAELDGPAGDDDFGSSVLVLGDVNGDEVDDFAISQANDGQSPGRVFVYTLATSAWSTGGPALAGLLGEPTLKGTGLLKPGTTAKLTLHYPLDAAPVTFVIGLSPVLAAFKGGVLGPSPDIVLPGFATSGASDLSVQATWPAGIPAGTQLWFQAWIAGDPVAPQGYAASNTLIGTVPM